VASSYEIVAALTGPGHRYLRRSQEFKYFLGWLDGCVTASLAPDSPSGILTSRQPKVTLSTLTPQRHQGHLLQMAHERLVDGYLTFLTHLIAEIISFHPTQFLPSGVIEEIAANRGGQPSRHDFFLGSFPHIRNKASSHKALADWLHDDFDLLLYEKAKDREPAVYVLDVRHAIAHNYGLASGSLVRSGKPLGMELRRNEEIPLPINFILSASEFLDGCAMFLDAHASDRWALDRVKLEYVQRDDGSFRYRRLAS
jgi:hypothetical protein